MFVPRPLVVRANNMLTMVDVARKLGNDTAQVVRELRSDCQMILSYDVPTEKYQVVVRKLCSYPTADDVCLAAAAFGVDPDTILPDMYRVPVKTPDGRHGGYWHCLRFRWRETPPVGAPVLEMSAPCEA